jgi:transposase
MSCDEHNAPQKPKRFFTPEEARQLADQDPRQLLDVVLMQIAQLQRRAEDAAKLRRLLKEKDARIAQLEKQLEEAKKISCRQAAPFRKPPAKRSLNPRKPGRKRGHPGACRPRPKHIDHTVKAPLTACPHCSGTHLENRRSIHQFIEDIPPITPEVTELITQEAFCCHCQETVRSTHPKQMSLAEGAAQVQLGPRALAFAADLNKSKGLSMRKTCQVLRDCFGLSLTPGGLSQALDRLAAKFDEGYQQRSQELRQANYVHADETSWWVGGPGYCLWVFTNDTTTHYHVSDSRGRSVIRDILGDNYSGVLISDCLSIYDDVNDRQQKCYSHHLAAIKEAREAHPALAEGYLADCRKMLKDAMQLEKEKTTLSTEEFAARRSELNSRADQLLQSEREEKAEEKIRNRLFKQRDHLFTFLDHDEVDATNNLAERQLRPAVIARKISCGNKTPKGAHTWEVLASEAATCTQRGESFIEALARASPLNGG